GMPSALSSAMRRSRVSSSAAVSTGCGFWSPWMRCSRSRARRVSNPFSGVRGGAISAPLRANAAISSANIASPRQESRSNLIPCPPRTAVVVTGPRALTISGRAPTSRALGRARKAERTMGYRVAVVGATGDVGREILNILAERQFPLDEVAAVASSRSTGDEIDFGDTGETLKIKNLDHFDFSGWD